MYSFLHLNGQKGYFPAAQILDVLSAIGFYGLKLNKMNIKINSHEADTNS